jgi:16S rRNA (cytosine967-C5)-methyltransferase
LGLRPKQTRGASDAGARDIAAPGLAVRLTATAILRQVVERGVPLDALVGEAQGNPHFAALDRRDRALVRAIVGTALRRRGEIGHALSRILDRPLPADSGALSGILHVAAAQILFLDVADHAAVNLAVAQAGGDRRTGRARGLVNGVLRRLVRERDVILAQADAPRLNTPGWLFERWARTYGETTATEIARAHLALPPLDLSVKGDAADWAEKLGGTKLPTGGIRLSGTDSVAELLGYCEGAWWVQDAAAALPAKLLGDVAGKKVADLCAAPGGKTAELAAAGAIVTALDISTSRLKRLGENLDRLGLEARLTQADLLAWEPGEQFEAVLLDAPCTATGTIRRHPDIPWLKRPQDIDTLSTLQGRMLDRAAKLVSPGGLLVYATCSLEPEEGVAQVAPFLLRHPEFTLRPIDAAELMWLGHLLSPDRMLRTLPCQSFGDEAVMQGMDGFFAARFRRA